MSYINSQKLKQFFLPVVHSFIMIRLKKLQQGYYTLTQLKLLITLASFNFLRLKKAAASLDFFLSFRLALVTYIYFFLFFFFKSKVLLLPLW